VRERVGVKRISNHKSNLMKPHLLLGF